MSIDTILGIFGTVLGIIGLITGYIFYRRSLRIKEPVYHIISKNLIRDSFSRVSGLEILHKGHKIKTLTVSNILFWNRGRATIEKTDIVNANPLRIECSQGNHILDMILIEVNNPSSQFALEMENNRTRAKILFDYLDKDQGAIIQVTHTGTKLSDISIEGYLKGAVVRKYAPPRKWYFRLNPMTSTLAACTTLAATRSLSILWQSVIIGFVIMVWLGIWMKYGDWLYKKLSGPFHSEYDNTYLYD